MRSDAAESLRETVRMKGGFRVRVGVGVGVRVRVSRFCEPTPKPLT